MICRAKVSTKPDLLRFLIGKVDTLVAAAGAIANAFLVAKGLEIDRSAAERGMAESARQILTLARAREVRSSDISLPWVAAIVHRCAPYAGHTATIADSREFTFSGNRAVGIAAIQPPWQRPLRLKNPPRSSIATIRSAR